MTTLPDESPRRAGAGRALAPIALALAVIAALMVASGGPGTRFGWWHFRTGFTMMRYGTRVALVAILIGVIAAALAWRAPRRKGLAIAAVALLLAAVTWFVPWNWRRGAGSVPPIHDITTDVTNPPPLVASRALRDSAGEAMNPWEYEGDSVAALQRKAYPDIRPVMLAMKPDDAYGAAYRMAREMGWEILEANRDERRIEALDRTAWFGFEDDVVIRVTPASGISRVDVRSVSRVGRGDMGMNAARIRKYLAKLRENYKDRVAESQ